MSVQPPTDDHQKHWLTRRSTIRGLWVAGILVLIATTALDLVIEGHPHFGFDGWPAFYSLFGFAACAAMVVFAKLLGFFLKRKDTYYE